MIRINQLKIKYQQKEYGNAGETLNGRLKTAAARLLKISEQAVLRLEILRESVDARKKPEIYLIYTVDVAVEEEERVLKRVLQKGGGRSGRAQMEIVRPAQYRFPAVGTEPQAYPTVIVGMGPAGLFCGYFLALHGFRPILLERGRAVEDRLADVERFWQTGALQPDSNVQFGEGGAGAFSDGKLNTLVKDKEGRNRAVLQTLVDCGADPRILYLAKPHIGTDELCDIVKRMRLEIIRLGGQVRFESKVTDIMIEDGRVCGVQINGTERLDCGQLVLAVGHSARDTFEMLYEKGIPMTAKSFAVGLRVEHPQKEINRSQYGMEDPGALGAAPYKVTAQAEDGRGVYSFCMCPGGYVVNASSEEGHLAVNGMSYSARDGSNANSAVIVAVTPEDFGSEHPLAGIAFQRKLERKAYLLADGKIPMQRYGVFRACVEQGCTQAELSGAGAENGKPEFAGQAETAPQNKGLCAWADVSTILPEACNKAFVQGMEAFGRQIRGFDRPDAILSGVESRTSSPLRIARDDTLQSEIHGLYPCGEGAGYAGGITSAAMDGLRVAEQIAARFAPIEK